MTTTEPTTDEAHAAAIADLEARVFHLNARLARYGAVQPVLANSLDPIGFDPRRVIEKYELAVQLDGANVALEEAKAARARDRVAAIGGPGELAALERDVAVAAAEAVDAAAAVRLAKIAHAAAVTALEHRNEAIAAATQDAARTRRWRS